MTTAQKVKFLIGLGYSEDFLNMIQDKKFAKKRFSVSDVIALENLVGKVVTVYTHYANGLGTKTVKVTRVDVRACSAGLFIQGGFIPCISKESACHIKENSVTIFRDTMFNMGNNMLRPATKAELKGKK